MTSEQLARALADRNGLDYVDLNVFEVDKGAANLISATEARRFRAIPVAFLDSDTILVATSNPANVLGLDDIAITTGYKVRRAVASPEDIEAVINQLSNLEESVQEVDDETRDPDLGAQVIELRESAEEAPVVKLVHSVIADAVGRGASDIHFDPRNGDMRVRFRVDGVVVDSATVPRRLAPGLVSRIKIMAELDIAERRAPQDGRVGLTVDGRYVDIRVATLPVVRGESVVMRILDKERVVADLDLLGMQAADRALLEHSIKQLHGAVLVTGPTGAGKTTTLYAALSEINTPDRTLITIEDPVEYELEGVKQMQVNAAAGVTFVRGLRSMIRNDPDVLMVGEIRDRETAQTAIESALTGHLVLSTLHTNDAPMAPARLIEMGIEPFLVATGARVRDRPAARPPALRGVPATRSRSPPRSCESNGFESPTGPIDAYEPGGLRALRRDRLPRPDRDLRGDGALEGAPLADPPQGIGRRDRRRRGRRAGCAACARTASRRCARGSPRSPRCSASSGRSSGRPTGRLSRPATSTPSAGAVRAENSPESRTCSAATAIAPAATKASAPPTLIRCAPASTISDIESPGWASTLSGFDVASLTARISSPLRSPGA